VSPLKLIILALAAAVSAMIPFLAAVVLNLPGGRS
jgi:hypothetical protein